MSTEEFMNPVWHIVTAVCVFCSVFLIRAWWNWRTEGLRSIPSKGSFGWPIVGETLSFVACGGDFTFEMWLRKRIQKYGKMFKTHVFLMPTIVMTTPEEVKFVLEDPHKQTVNGFPGSAERLFGSSSIFVLEGKEFRDVHKILSDSLLMPELKPKTPEFNRLMRLSLRSWDGQTVEMFGAVQKIVFRLLTFNFFGIPWEDEDADRITTLLDTAIQGITSVPISFPGTIFYKAQNARMRINEILVSRFRDVRSAESGGSSEFASTENFPYRNLFNFELNSKKVSDLDISDILLGPIFAGAGLTSAVCLAIYHLSRNPSVLQKAQAEVDRIRKRKEERGETDLLVSDLKDLKYLTQVFKEVLRISSIVQGSGRFATSDMHFNGYVIPKGWLILQSPVLIHMNPEWYPDPSKFDPDRFESPPNPGKFFPFGRGYRACLGRDFAKLVVLMALYHILSSFTWDVVSCSDKFKYLPYVRMIGGFHISIKSRTDIH